MIGFKLRFDFLNLNRFTLSALLILAGLAFYSELQPQPSRNIRYWKSGTEVREPRLSYQWNSTIDLRGQFFRSGNNYRFEAQSINKAGLYIEVQTIPLRNDRKIPEDILSIYLGSECNRQGTKDTIRYHCLVPKTSKADSSTLNSSSRQSEDMLSATNRFVRIDRKDDLLHIFYMAYSSEFSSPAKQIIASSVMRSN